MTVSHPVVRVRGLTKRYGDRTVVDGLDLDVAAGECVALLGPNGAGKTTTVEILEGFRTRDSGEVTVLGVDPADGDRAWRARLGVVAQHDLGAVDLTVAEMLRHFAVYHRDPRPLGELVVMVGLQEQVNTRVTTLSGGQRRRLDVALGVQGRPELLFLDEPTTGFDPAARRQFWALLERLQGEHGTTILLTTHYLDEAAHLADRVAVIARGRLVEVSPPDALGGRLTLGATVSWRDAHGAVHERRSGTPTELLRRLLAEDPDGVEILAVTRPSLEDVYLTLIDDEAGEA